ncbi:MAG TPA: prolyl oligopeptidase family serine peptidase [Planctomycetota bacterium]|jgi:dienelactone hydrolase
MILAKRLRTPTYFAAGLLICASVLGSFSAASAAENSVAPALEADLGADGLMTWWLYSPVQKVAFDTASPPRDAREGQPVAGAAGQWALIAAPQRFVDFKPFLNNAGSGVVFASAKLQSATGGKRLLRGGTYCGLKVFIDGELKLNKPQPTAPMSDESRAEIEIPKGTCEISVAVTVRSGHCGFQLMLSAVQAGAQQPEPVAGDKILVPTAAGKEPDTAAATLTSMAFLCRQSFVKAGDRVVLLAGFGGSLPKVERLTGRLSGPGGAAIGQPLAALTPQELSRTVWQSEYVVPAATGLAIPVTLEVRAGEKVLGTKKIELYSLEGLTAAAKELETSVAQRAAKAGRKMPGATLAVDKLTLILNKITSGEERISNTLGDTLQELIASARRCADLEEKGQDPWAGKTGYFERAYQSAIDDSAQPYFIDVPANFAMNRERTAKYPLVVFLHGYVPSYDKDRWWGEMPEFNVHFEKNNAFLAIPFARSNTDFWSCGEVDVLDVIAEVKRTYPIDDDRVYLYGYSMGGMATYHMAAHNSDMFAACVVLAGRADSPLQNKRPMENYHPFKQWLMHADNPISLCENFTNIPVRIYHGKSDMVISVDEAKRMEARFKELGCDAALNLSTGDHLSLFDDVMTKEEPVKWLLTQKRNAAPAKRRIKSYSLKYAHNGEVQALATTGELKPIELEWTSAGGAVTFTKDSDIVLARSVKGETKGTVPAGLHKTPQRCGPVRDAITRPFVAVYGTSGSPEANRKNKENADKFAKEWYAFTRSRITPKADKDVTDEEKKTKNLFLFGEQQDNLIHAAAAVGRASLPADGHGGPSYLPIAVKNGNVTIGEKTLPLAGLGTMFIYPSPFAPADGSQVIVVFAGLWFGRELGPNHKLDLVPDFLVFNDKIDPDGTSTNQAICAGFFNGEWKLDPKLMWWFEK